MSIVPLRVVSPVAGGNRCPAEGRGCGNLVQVPLRVVSPGAGSNRWRMVDLHASSQVGCWCQ